MEDNYIGKYMKTLRKSNKYTQEYVATYLSVIRQTYSHYETGRIQPPLDVIYNLAQLYKVPITNFMPESPNIIIDEYQDENMLPRFQVNSLLYDSSEINLETELITYFRPLDKDDKEDILALARVKYKRLK